MFLLYMDLRHLETFVKIAELKSFTKAAEKLFLTQPTVSKQVVDLERYFGIKLLDRTKRYVTLTKAGEIVLQYTRDLLNIKKELISTMDAFKGLARGNILIGASNIPGVYVLPKILKKFKSKYGGIEVRVLISDTRETVSNMEEGIIDIGFVGARVEGKGIDYRKVAEDTVVIVAPPEYPDSMKLDEMPHYPVVMREAGSGTRNIFEKALVQAINLTVDNLNIVAEMTDTEAIKQAIKSGIGISFMSRMAITDEVRHGTMKIVHFEGFPEIRRPIYMVTKRGKTLLPHVKVFIKTVEELKKHEKK